MREIYKNTIPLQKTKTEDELYPDLYLDEEPEDLFGTDTDEEEPEKEQAVLDIIPAYIRTIGEYDLFTPEEEVYYGKMLKGSEQERAEAKEKFILHNLRLVLSISKHYTTYGMSLEDIVQEGTIGLMKAIDRYDVDTGYRFSTYSTWWIRQAIHRALHDTGRNVRIPVHIQEKLSRIRKAVRELEVSGIEPTDKEIAFYLNMEERDVKNARKFEMDTVSLNLPVGDEKEAELEEMLCADTKSPEELYIEKERKEVAEALLECLSEREQFIIRERFGMNDDTPKTLEQIAQMFHITRERVRQIENKAMKKLRHPKRKEIIGDYSL